MRARPNLLRIRLRSSHVLVVAGALSACSANESNEADPILGAPSSDGAVPSDGGVATDSSPPDDSAVADASGAADATDEDAGSSKKRVFVSSTTYTGDLKSAGAGTSGLDGADKLCNSLATKAGLGGTWKAWLSISGTKAASRLADVGGWHLVGTEGTAGKLVFVNLGATASSAAVAINRTESGGSVVGMVYPVWTGTRANGNVGDTCTNWSSAVAANMGTRGASNATLDWTEHAAPGSCDEKKAIYCFEQ